MPAATRSGRKNAMKKFVPAILFTALYLSPLQAATVSGKSIVMSGNGHGVPACASCHGAQGQGFVADGAPALAGIPKVAIVGLLSYLAKGGGMSLIMQSYASRLTPPEIDAVAQYFSSLPIPNQ